MNFISFVVLFMLSGLALAGGDSVRGKVSNFSGKDGNYSFRFTLTDRRSELLACREFEVRVRYERVPWYSWLPFVYTTHPAKEETTEAASFLLNAQRQNREINFGYMGGGLIPTDRLCSFVSRGLSIYSSDKKNLVLSFYDPV